MWFSPQTLSIITTHRCTAACEHCCFGCSPKEERAIPVPRLHALIEETAAVPSLRQVVFTGGECFLLGAELDALVRRCTALGLRSRCVSNGYWAVSAAAGRARVDALMDAGLGELSLSTGVFHARYVPLERVVWAAAAAAEAGLGVVINVEAFEGAVIDGLELAENPLLQPFLADARVQINQGAWVPNGGEGEGCAAPLTHGKGFLRFRQEAGSLACGSSLRVISVTPDQDLVTCCGLNLEYIPQLHVASLRGQTLAEALAEVQPDLLKMWIHVAGPERVLEFVRSRAPDFPLPLHSAHICQTCQVLHDSAEALAVLARHQGEVEAEILENYLLVCAGDTVLAQL